MVEKHIGPLAVSVVQLGHAVDEGDVAEPLGRSAGERRPAGLAAQVVCTATIVPALAAAATTARMSRADGPAAGRTTSTPAAPGRIAFSSVSSQPADRPSTATSRAWVGARVSDTGSEAQTACCDRVKSSLAGPAMVT